MKHIIVKKCPLPYLALKVESVLCHNHGVKINRGYKAISIAVHRWSRIIILCTMEAFLLSCQSVPITGRQQLVLITPEEEIALGEEAYKNIIEESTLSHDQAKINMVRRVGQRIASVADRPDYRWEFNLIENKTSNAFALPGGKVAVYTGILQFTEDETGLAVVMGHEVAHALAHHGAERMSTSMITQIGTSGVAVILGGDNPQTVKAIEKAFGIGGQVGIILPFSRKHESEADKIGLHLMAEAGYDPRQSAEFWKRMTQDTKEKPLEFFSTHPSDEQRIRQIESWLPEVLPIYQKHSMNHPRERF
jgi:metalloendopeptidase OMA1, mitochondrial